jgi:GMP synthase-like glutamine amidotransferase
MKPLHIAILDLYCRHPNQGMRCIKHIIDEQLFPVSWQVFDVRYKGEIPDFDFDVYIASGGPGDPTIKNERWVPAFFDLIEKIFSHNQSADEKKFLFLICHSFQMVCHHWQLSEVCLRRKPAFGIFPVHKTTEGEKELLLSRLPDPFYAVDSRHWQIINPVENKIRNMGAAILALEKIRPHVPLQRAVMAMRFSPEIFGTQFHPEADVMGMQFYFNQKEKKKEIIENHGLEKYQEMIAGLNDPEKILLTHRTILPLFLLQAAVQLRNFRPVKSPL